MSTTTQTTINGKSITTIHRECDPCDCSCTPLAFALILVAIVALAGWMRR